MQRNLAIDIMKGIAIMLVVVGHSGYLPPSAVKFVFTFHMPLFFIVSGYLYKPRPVKESLMKDFKRLMVPYFVTCVAVILFYLVIWLKTGDNTSFKYYLSATFWGNGTIGHKCRYFSTVPAIGAIWFFPALFVCKNVYNALTSKSRILWSAFIFLIATLIGKYIVFIPFSVLSGLSAILFFAIGDKCKTIKSIKAHWMIIGIACWVISFFSSAISLARPQMDLYYIDIIGATTATFIVYYLSIQLEKLEHTLLRTIPIILSWLGRYSLLILCFHLIELDCNLADYMPYSNLGVIRFTLKIVLPILLTALFVFIENRAKKIFRSS